MLTPRLVLLCNLSVNFLVAIRRNGKKPHPLSGLPSRESNLDSGVLRLACPLVEKLGGLEVAVSFREIADVVE